MAVNASKILTVSYGSFSCTLEGFDRPFEMMKAIAEYFRDLSAEDRYFGAEPPKLDAEALQLLAQREARQPVETRIAESGVILRAPAAASSVVATPVAQVALPIKKDVPEPVAEPQPVQSPVAQSPVDDAVSEKLAHIRQAVAAARAAAGRNAVSAAPVITPAIEEVEAEFGDPAPEDLSNPFEEPVLPTVEAIEANPLPKVALAPDDGDDEVAEDVPEDVISGVADLLKAEDPPAQKPHKRHKGKNGKRTKSEDTAPALPDEDMEEVEASEVADQEPETDRILASVTQITAQELPPEPAVEEPAPEPVTPDTTAAEVEEASVSDDIAAALAAFGQQDFGVPEIEEELDEPLASDAATADQPPVPDAADAQDDYAEVEPVADQERMFRAHPVIEEPEVIEETPARPAPLSLSQAEPDQAPEASEPQSNQLPRRRNRITMMSELDDPVPPVAEEPAPVAAPITPRRVQSQQTAAQADGSVTPVRPARVQASELAARPATPAPLVLAPEQRISQPPAASTAAPEASEGDAIRPRRVMAANLKQQLADALDDGLDAAPVPDDGRGFAHYAEAIGARDLSDLLEAAAAYTAQIEGQGHFSPPQIMHKISSVASETEFSREDRLRVFGKLLRQGKIAKVRPGEYTITEASAYFRKRG